MGPSSEISQVSKMKIDNKETNVIFHCWWKLKRRMVMNQVSLNHEDPWLKEIAGNIPFSSN